MDIRRLRIGIVLDGRLVEETLVPAGQDMTLGTRAGCTSVLPGPGLPSRWHLFRWRRGRYWLNPLPRMRVRLSQGQDSSTGTTPLGERAHGKATLGEITVLFQMVPPPRARPRLPVGLRASLSDQVDGVFTAFVLTSLLLHATIVLQLRRVDWPRRPVADEVSADFPRLVRRALPPPAPVKIASIEPAPVTTPAPHRKSAPIIATIDRRPTLREQVSRMGVLGLLTAKGDQPGGIVDVLSRGNVDQQAEEAFRGLGGVTVATTDPRLLIHAGDGTGRVAETKTLDIGGARIAEADTGAHHERRISVHTGALDLESTSTGQLDPAQLARAVKERVGALRACYERALKRTPTLHGKLVLHISITAAGTVSAADVDSESLQDVEMGECIRTSVLRWRFPAPEGGRLEVSFPFVFQAAE